MKLSTLLYFALIAAGVVSAIPAEAEAAGTDLDVCQYRSHREAPVLMTTNVIDTKAWWWW